MLRPALTAGLTTSALAASLALAAGLSLAASLALAAPAMAGGDPHSIHQAPTGSGWGRPGQAPAPRSVRRHHRAGPVQFYGSPVRPVSYGETDGAAYHAWLPRNANLPIYNVPPPFFPEP